MRIHYYSLNKVSPTVGFREAVIHGQAPDKGLYFPSHIPQVDKQIFTHIEALDDAEICFRVIQPYVNGEIPDEALFTIVQQTIAFPLPLVQVTSHIASLELFHGPTWAFKDVGARFMSRCLGYFTRQHKLNTGKAQKIVVLVATSGDTGGAVAAGFEGVEGVEVVILYPSGKVSKVQEQQLTTQGQNIHAIEIEGSFDDCQQMVKHAFADMALRSRVFLTSANSINIARWLPQQFYYFLAWKQWQDKDHPPVISVPSGNFGNIGAGLLAYAGGLPVQHFIAACNLNDVVPRFLQTGKYEVHKAIPTLSNAMDVGDPSNFIRILTLFEHRLDNLKNVLSAYSISDDETLQTMRRVYRNYGYLTDPHGAVGMLALERYMQAHPGRKGYFLETAHPVKFPDAVAEVMKDKIPAPSGLEALMQRPKKAIKARADNAWLRDFLESL